MTREGYLGYSRLLVCRAYLTEKVEAGLCLRKRWVCENLWLQGARAVHQQGAWQVKKEGWRGE